MSQKKSFWIFLLLSVCMLVTACGKQEEPVRNYENAQDLAYEIVTGSDVPHKVNEKIYKAKEKGFGFAYRDGETMYTIFGFGKQNTGGYSIQVLAVKETDSAVVIEAKLVAPEAEEVISTSPSYPYMILKMTNVEKDVQFLLH